MQGKGRERTRHGTEAASRKKRVKNDLAALAARALMIMKIMLQHNDDDDEVEVEKEGRREGRAKI